MDSDAVAAIIRPHVDDLRGPSADMLSASTVLGSVAGMIADAFERSDQPFDRDRFFATCGYRLVDGTWT